MIGSTIGPYRVRDKVGEGGMGEVYRARDTRLDRDVAIKILPELFAADPERLARFEREAKTLALLNHPHIAQIYGLETLDGASVGRALVMELVEGEDLSARIARGPIPVAEALAIARQIADALEAAHERGIIHRDLKPANVKVRSDGTAKVLDFGLAKAIEPDSPVARDFSRASESFALANSPTLTSPATQLGVILGTAAYMAPEQAKGRAIDRRADVWAFGVVLFEMLTGKRAFEGDDVSELLVSVLRDAPAFDALPPDTPEPIRRLLRRCLEKDPRERLAEMSAVRIEIRDALSGGSGTIVGAHARRGERHVWTRMSTGLAILAAALAAALVWSVASRPAVGGGGLAVRFPLVNDPNLRVTKTTTQPFAVSPDGRMIVFSANAGSGVHLWVRTLDTLEPRMLAHTEGAFQPAISPNGEWVAFVVSNHLIRKVRIAGGAATTITSLDDVTASLAWVSDEEIVFEMIGSRSGIHRARANGGPAELLIPLDGAAGEIAQRRPLVLGRERAVLYTSLADAGPATLAMFSLDGGRRSRLGVTGLQALGIVDSHLLYSRDDGALMAVLFDAGGMRTLGEPRELTDRVARSGMGTAVALSPSGTLAFTPPEARMSRLLVADASGRAIPVGGWEREFERPRFSPDGRRIAVGIVDGDARDLWILDRASAEPTRVTRGGRDTLVGWTPDGRALIHLREGKIWTTAVDGSAEPRTLVAFNGTAAAAAIMPDGKSIVALRMNQAIVLVSIETGDERPIIASARSGRRPRPYEVTVSPDGQWAAYTDRNEQEVYVRAVDGSAGIQVSNEGGERPIWGPDGRLFYEGPGGLMTVQLQFSPALAVPSRTRVTMAATGAVHDVTPDGKTFLILEPTTRGPGVLVALDWAGDVRRQLRIK